MNQESFPGGALLAALCLSLIGLADNSRAGEAVADQAQGDHQ